jgi:2-methylcitrate dehydratase PrpD
VALNGSTTPSARAVVRAIEQVGRTGSSIIVGTSSRALPEYAALANGAASHSIEWTM